MYSPELLEKKEKKLTHIAFFAFLFSFTFFFLPDNLNFAEEGYTPIIASYLDIFSDMLSVIGILAIFPFLLMISPFICCLLFFISLFKMKPSSKIKIMNIAFIFFPYLLTILAAFVIQCSLFLNNILDSTMNEYQWFAITFFIGGFLLFIPFLISYIRTKKYFKKECKAEEKAEKKIKKEIEKENKRVEKAYVAEIKKERKLSTTVTRDKDICIHIEFI